MGRFKRIDIAYDIDPTDQNSDTQTKREMEQQRGRQIEMQHCN